MASDPNRAYPDLERGSSRHYSREKAKPTSSTRRKTTHSYRESETLLPAINSILMGVPVCFCVPVHVDARVQNTMPPRSARSVRSSGSRSSEIGSPLSTKLSSIPERHESPAHVVRKPPAAELGVERPAVVVAPAVVSPEAHHAPDPGVVKRLEKGQVHDIEDDRISVT
ncbi:hypothetical protein VdG1_03988 [Verticillium dahliae VDG1]|nr:hypothetical protein VdG1_03988 [Verticillium dahliae VDG1]